MKVGVLALQGAFAKHIEMLNRAGAEGIEVRTLRELQACEGLIIPGGESTTMMRHIAFMDMKKDLLNFAHQKPVFGTCAGLILMSTRVLKDPMEPFELLDIEVERNAFGRQAESFRTEIELSLSPKKSTPFHAVFIRAPRIRLIGSDVTVLARMENEPVLVRQGKYLGATFHPELTEDPTIHSYFLGLLGR